MKLTHEIQIEKELKKDILNFLKIYEISDLKHALQLYTNMHQVYICKTKTSISKININEIYYMDIKGHHITVYTKHDEYQKYGTLNKELKSLASHGFAKCTQNCIVSLRKIKTIYYDSILLSNNTKIHMSKRYATEIIMAYTSL